MGSFRADLGTKVGTKMGKKLKHTSSRLKGLGRSGSTGLWEVRKAIPEALRPVFGKREFKAALNTKDENVAIRLGAPLIADWSDQIEKAKGEAVLAVVPPQRQAIDRDRAYLAIQRWQSQQIRDALNLAFNGALEPAPVGGSDEMLAHVQMVGDLRSGDWRCVPEFDVRLASTLNSERIHCDPLHPAIPAMRLWFAGAMAAVEHAVMEYRKGNLSQAPEAPAPVIPAVIEPPVLSLPPVNTQSGTGMRLMDLFDRYQANSPKTVLSRHRGYVTRLMEYLGDPDIASIQPLHLLAFRSEIERFPKEKRDISNVPFMTAIAEAQKANPNYERLMSKTVWTWTQTYKRMFKFAVQNDLLTKNPAENMMAKPSKELSAERDVFGPDDIEAIFSTPLFQGASGKLDSGYRKNPGAEIIKDHKYWLPLFCLFHGCRIEEPSAAKVSEFKVHDGIHYLDLSKRPAYDAPRRVKNASAKRLVPLHKRIIELGFLIYLEGLDSEGFAFPLIGSEDNKSATSMIKWWGLWARANAKTPGVGMDDPLKPFHSFRHTWMAASATNPDIKERLSDLISGHAGDGNKVARHYGASSLRDPAILPILKPQIDLIDFPTFPT